MASMAERSSEFALDGAEDAALLAGDEDALRVLRIVAAITLVDIGALDDAAGELFGILDGGAQRVAIIRIARQCLGLQYELAARRAGFGGGDRYIDAELIGCAGLALADAFDLRRMEGIEFPAALTLLLRADLGGARQWPSEDLLQDRLASDLAADVADDAAET